MESYLTTFKNHVPAEILAAFIAINTLVPYDASYDMKIILSAMGVLVVFFVLEAWQSERFASRWTVVIVAGTLPFWCIMIAIERFEEHFASGLFRVAVSVILIITSLALTLFAAPKGDASNASP